MLGERKVAEFKNFLFVTVFKFTRSCSSGVNDLCRKLRLEAAKHLISKTPNRNLELMPVNFTAECYRCDLLQFTEKIKLKLRTNAKSSVINVT